jgi:cellobiose-specific phosphotransferase system component IIC
MNPWLVFSLILLGVWLLVWLARPGQRKEMLWASILTAPFGLTEPLFVPAYWNPPSLFNLAATTGFDLESLVFSFAIGGIGAVIYETLFKPRHVRMSAHEKMGMRHQYHLWALVSPLAVFVPLHLLTSLNPIYTASIAMLVGAASGMVCRPDLKTKIAAGSLLFLALYFVFFLGFNLAYPGFVQEVWNLPALSGILISGVPLEELMFAFTFGGLWSSYYEHVNWYRLARGRKQGR